MASPPHESLPVRYYLWDGILYTSTDILLHYPTNHNVPINDIGLCIGPSGLTTRFLRSLAIALNLEVTIYSDTPTFYRDLWTIGRPEVLAALPNPGPPPRIHIRTPAAEGNDGLERLGRMAHLLIQMLDNPAVFWDRIVHAPEFVNAFNTYIQNLQDLGINPNDRRIPAHIPFHAPNQ